MATTPTRRAALAAFTFILLTAAIPASAQNFNNPLAGLPPGAEFETILTRIATFLLGLSISLVFATLIYGGVRLTLGGFDNEQEAARAKKIILWALIGFAVVWGSWAIIRLFVITLFGGV